MLVISQCGATLGLSPTAPSGDTIASVQSASGSSDSNLTDGAVTVWFGLETSNATNLWCERQQTLWLAMGSEGGFFFGGDERQAAHRGSLEDVASVHDAVFAICHHQVDIRSPRFLPRWKRQESASEWDAKPHTVNYTALPPSRCGVLRQETHGQTRGKRADSPRCQTRRCISQDAPPEAKGCVSGVVSATMGGYL